MSVKRGLRLQCRVRDDAPDIIKNSAAALFSDFCKRTCPYITMINSSSGYIRPLDALMTNDTNVRVSVLENIPDKLGDFVVYQFQYKDNKHKTFALSNTGDIPFNKKDLSNKTKAFTKTGALGGVRTHNLLIRSQMLYPIELRVHSTKFDKFNITK